MRRSTFAGEPAAIECGSIEDVTTLFAPITQRSPMLTPLVTTTVSYTHLTLPTNREV